MQTRLVDAGVLDAEQPAIGAKEVILTFRREKQREKQTVATR